MAHIETYLFPDGPVEVRLGDDYLGQAERCERIDATLIMPPDPQLEHRFNGLLALILDARELSAVHLTDSFPVFAANIFRIALLKGGVINLTTFPLPHDEPADRIESLLDTCEITAQYLLGYVTLGSEPPGSQPQAHQRQPWDQANSE